MGARVRKKKVDARQAVYVRFTLIAAVLVLWMGGIAVRLVNLQVTNHDWLRERAQNQRLDIKSSKLPRGTIFDRNERTLSMSIRVKTLYADPTAIDEPKTVARKLAKVLGGKESDIFKQITEAKADEKRFLALSKGLDEESVQRINAALEDTTLRKSDLPKFDGLHWREEQRRSYPYGTLAAHVIGFSNSAGIGQAGIEQSQNTNLFGAVIKKRQERDRLGRVYDETISEKEPPKDVVLTISAPIQYMAEQAIERAVKASSSKSGIAIVLDNRNGEILAMANYPTFDPNNLNGINGDNLANAAIQSIYSPGSAMKLVTYGTALDRGLIKPDGEIDSGNGSIEIAKHRFTDSHAIGRVSYTKAFAHSSNVCAIKTAMRVGKQDFYQSLQNFGFGRPTGVELPAETGGIVRTPERWNGDSLASMSIGYEIGVSALQMATAFATIANDGVRIQPHIIKEIRLSNDQIVPMPEPAKTQVVKAEAARDLKVMMKEVINGGTGKRARLDGYTSAGKTGTAWKFDEKLKKVNSAKYVSSFIGFAPAENPAVTIAIVMDEPKVGGRDGGQVAGPVFREIAQQILPELEVKRDAPMLVSNDDEQIEEDYSEMIAEKDPDAVNDDDDEAVLTTAANAKSKTAAEVKKIENTVDVRASAVKPKSTKESVTKETIKVPSKETGKLAVAKKNEQPAKSPEKPKLIGTSSRPDKTSKLPEKAQKPKAPAKAVAVQKPKTEQKKILRKT